MKTWLQEQAEHHRRLIKEPTYWMLERLADSDALNQLSINQDKEVIPPIIITQLQPNDQVEINQLKARLNYLTKKYGELEKKRAKQVKEEKL